MVNRLQSWIFLSIALLTMGWGMIPVVRVAFGLDDKLTGSYIWSVSFIIGGLMCGPVSYTHLTLPTIYSV